MKTYSFDVIETIAIRKVYDVEAENIGEAWTKAKNGEMIKEREVKVEGVLNRNVVDRI